MMDIKEGAELPDREEIKIIPRSYQQQLGEKSLQKNSIIYLPTGSGKTYIAIMIIKKMKKDTMKPWKEGGKRSVFLVNNVPLVQQQRAEISKLVAVQVGGYSSENNVDSWKRDKWDLEFSKNQVLVMTCQILVNLIDSGFVKLQDINLLIFDECHHAVEDHPMRQIMKTFEYCPVNQQPRVIGLTATLLNANVKLEKVHETIKLLETTLHATIATVDNMEEVLGFSTNPREIIITYSTLPVTDVVHCTQNFLTELIEIVKNTQITKLDTAIKLGPGQFNVTKDPKALNKRVINIVNDCINQITTLGLFGGSLNILAYIIVLERYRRNRDTPVESLFFKFIISHLQRARAMLEHAMSDVSGIQKINKYSSEQILKTISTLKEYDDSQFETRDNLLINHSKSKLAAIIFVRQRFTAKVLYNILKEVKTASPKSFEFLRHDFIVGFNINPFNNTIEELYESKMSKSALYKFRKGDINCLISTSVIEEGVDIPQCSLILGYDAPMEYRSYIQSKGRARNKTSSYVMLVEKTKGLQFQNKYRSFQLCENHIRDLVVGIDREEIASEVIKQELYDDIQLEPFFLPSGARITENSAISLLNQYCSLLPSDLFNTPVTPDFIMQKFDEKFQMTIYMPIDCPVKDPIKGEIMSTQKLAKRSAALNACIQLYRIGALDQETGLPKRYAIVDFEQPDIKDIFPNWENEVTKDKSFLPGTKKKLRKHDKVHPKCLSVNTVKAKKQSFVLHVIDMKVNFQKPEDTRDAALYDLLMMDQCYALLTHNHVDEMCQFPIYLAVGEVQVNVRCNYSSIELTDTVFQQVKEFHHLVFDKVLNIAKKFVAFNNRDSVAYVVPVKVVSGRLYKIDWDVIMEHKFIAPVDRPDDDKRRGVRVTPDYKYSVISPWYRGSMMPDRYIVSDILYDISLNSSMDATKDTGTYIEYYRSKYNLTVLGDRNQPLLKVKQINSRLNCLLPRAATLNTLEGKQLRFASAAQGDDKRNTFSEFLVAEFCVKYDFPGVLWYKATALPSILHRILMLQVANDLRKEIARATLLGNNVPTSHKWKPLTLDVDIATKSLLGYCDPDVRNEGKCLSVDRINNRGDTSDELLPPTRLTTMSQSLIQLQLKKLEEEYPWDKNKEPMDIERNVTSVTLMDIECYDEFMMKEVVIDTTVKPPSPASCNVFPAIGPPPPKNTGRIEILSKTTSEIGVELRDILTALTVIKSHDTFNMERTETLGDSFLKFASTLYLFHKFPTLNEGQLTNIKGKLIGNRNLFYAGRRVNLGGRIKAEAFSPRNDFIQPACGVPEPIIQLITETSIRPTFLIGVELSVEEQMSGVVEPRTMSELQKRIREDDAAGMLEKETPDTLQAPMQQYLNKQLVPDKVVADCVESLVGVYMLENGLSGGITILQWLRILPPQDDFTSYLTKRVSTALTDNKTTVDQVEFLLDGNREEIEKIINYKFKDPTFLLQAFSHPSFTTNHVTRSYERLEFLGDAVLDFLITAYIFESDVALKPGQLTDLRSALVNNVTFACYVVKLGLHKYIQSKVNPSLEKAVSIFVEHQEQRNHHIGEDVNYLIDETDCKISQYVQVPKVLSDIFESLAGAIYLDSGGDLKQVWSIFYGIMWREIAAFGANIPIQPVRQLYEMIHACPRFGPVQYISKDVMTCMAPVTVSVAGRVITVHGFGSNKAQAKRAASKLALRQLQAAH